MAGTIAYTAESTPAIIEPVLANDIDKAITSLK